MGQGERRTFREALKILSNLYPEETLKLLPLIPYYGRWDDIFYLDNVDIGTFLAKQIDADLESENPSLLAKWMPSENASSIKTKELARKFRKYLGLSSKKYRSILTTLRAKINLVETKISNKEWSEVVYSGVPSKAGMKYKKAFEAHDSERYNKFLTRVESGEEKINTSTLFPYEIVRDIRKNTTNKTLEVLWNNLPDYTNNDEKALVVADTSGSMSWSEVDGVKPIDVAVSLAMYFAERNKGVFKNKFINFSSNPTLQELKGETLYQRITNLDHTEWGGSTNIQGVFDLVLKTAVNGSLPQEDMPSSIYIISDMEFNGCTYGVTNFEDIKRKYKEAGYEMPVIVFWNVNSHQNNVPVDKNEQGVILISGASASTFKMAIERTTPYKFMLDVLNGERYSKVDEVLIGDKDE